MEIIWYGHAAFGIEPHDGPRIITDPYNPDVVGYAPIRDSADLVLTSSDDDEAHCRADLIPGEPVVVNMLDIARASGSTREADVQIYGIQAAEGDDRPDGDIPGQNAMYRFSVDGITLAHMGDVGNPLSEAQQSFFERVDVLFALAGGYLTIEIPDLMEMIRRVRPKIVIPMHFRTLTYKPRNSHWIERFLSEFDDADVDFVFGSTATLTKDDLPDKTRVLVMDYVR
ncbi:MAG: MBL fold metallo-hydrolase [Pseudomonadota bacterium]